MSYASGRSNYYQSLYFKIIALAFNMEFFEIAQWGITGSTRNVADNMCVCVCVWAGERLISLDRKKKPSFTLKISAMRTEWLKAD